MSDSETDIKCTLVISYREYYQLGRLVSDFVVLLLLAALFETEGSQPRGPSVNLSTSCTVVEVVLFIVVAITF